MIDLTEPKGRILAAALDLAATRPWREITLLDIATASGLSLAELSEEVGSKADLLRYFTKQVDKAVIATPPLREEGETGRDRLFEVIMNRFDVMAPYKPALKSIVRDGGLTPAQLRAVMSSQYWMLQAAGISTDGITGQAKVAGLLSVYAAVFHKWLDDDDEGLSRTMAALDRRLRRGEASLQRLDDAVSGVSSVVTRIGGLMRGGSRTRDAKDSPAGSGDGDGEANATATAGLGDPANDLDVGQAEGASTGPAGA